MTYSVALEHSLREISEGLRSSRVTDRKKNAEKLKDFLTMKAVPSMLTENTLKRKGYSWNDLYDDIYEYILKETEKFETSKTFENVTAPLCTNLLNLCVSGSNKGKAYIKCDKVTDGCLLILKDNRLKKAIGDAYLNLLYKHVLPQEHYLGFITPTTWEDLLDASLSACISNYSRLDDYAKLRIVLLVMKNAINYCQFVIFLRDALPKWKRCFLKVAHDKKAQEVIVEIMILLFETLSTECRLSLCHFMEITFTQILKFYDQNMDQRKKSQLFQLLHYNVILHHPQGRQRNQAGSLADDWELWTKQLHNILELICLEITVLQRMRKTTDDLMKQCNHFYNLSAAVYFQIFALSESSENEVETASKRQKLCFNKNKTFNDLIDELRQNNMPWLGIVHSYVKHNGYSISIDDYLSLLKVIQSLVTGANVSSRDIFEDLVTSVLNNLATYISCRKHESEAIIVDLWNSCVRNSTVDNAGHKAVHRIMQSILTMDILNYQNANSLFKFYVEREMPVTCDSVNTLNKLFHKFFNKYSYNDTRSKCFTWLAHGNIASLDLTYTKELLLRLLSNENTPISIVKSIENNLYDTIFNSPEKCILFNEFELEINDGKIEKQPIIEVFELNTEIEKQMTAYFKENIIAYTTKIQTKSTTPIEYIKLINIVLVYLDILLKCNFYTEEQFKDIELYRLLRNALKSIYAFIDNSLISNEQISSKIMLLQTLKETLLIEMEPVMNTTLRSCIHEDFFVTINKILMLEVKADDDEDIVYANDEKEMNVTTLKHNCTLVLAAYCKKDAEHREYLLKHILDPKLYDFSVDSPCLFQCIELLNDGNELEKPAELLFTLMQYMVRDLYRNPDSSRVLLKNLLGMLDTVWSSQDQMKQNCYILMKSYVTRCEKLHYPPKVAALIYKCVARTAMLNRKHNFDEIDSFENVLTGKIKGDIHSLRIYCCYLLKVFFQDGEDDANVLLTELGDIFKINVSDGQELFLKDESINRTLTVLHCYLALAQTKKGLIHQLVTAILKLQKDNCLDKLITMKVLKKIINVVGITSLESYVNKHILSILYFWFSNKFSVDELPVYLLGYDNLEEFKEKYIKWLISADILWRKEGNVNNTDFLKQTTANELTQNVTRLVEVCFTEIIALCLPYIVTEKYTLGYRGIEQPTEFKKSMDSAQKLFRLTGQILENEKWTDLFVENVGNLVLMTASQLGDRSDSMKMFNVKISGTTKPYSYPKDVFSSILEYFGDLTGGNIMQYLCENQPLVIFQVLFNLWETVLDEHVIDFKIMALNAFIVFFKIIPFSLPSDAFVSNFTIKSFTHGIKNCKSSEELQIFAKGAKIVIEKLVPEQADLIRESVSELLPILIVKREEGLEKECNLLFEYLTIHLKCYLKPSEDVTDFVNALSQSDRPVNSTCSTVKTFHEKLKTMQSSLINPSLEILSSLHQLLKANTLYLYELYGRISIKGFSEDCGSSIIHQLIYTLSNILKSVYYDKKIIIEACNCLSVIGTYDLKTLVTVPPLQTQNIVDMGPKHYIACVILKSLSDVMFDDDPVVTSKVTQTLNNLFKYREGHDALDLESVDKQILRPLTSSTTTSVEIKIHKIKFDQYCIDNFDGIFIKAFTSNWNVNDTKNHGKWLKEVTTALSCLVESPTNFFKDLREICSIKSSVCRKVLPSLVGLLLHCSTEIHVETISRQINMFFNYIWEHTFDDKTEGSGDISHIYPRTNNVLDNGQKMVIQYMLNIVDFIRLQRRYYKPRPDRTVESLNYLRLEYDKVAWAATVADQNLAAIYYGELWAVARNGGVPPSAPEATTNLPGGVNIQKIFRKCYVSIGEMDAIDGCGTAHLTIESEKRKHLINTGQYTDALLLHDIALSCGQMDHDLHCGTVRSLHNSGMHHLALQYIKSLPEDDEMNDIKYECMAFLGDWSEIVDTKELEDKSKQANCNPHSIIKAFHYACLRDCFNVQTTDIRNKLLLPLNRAKLAISSLCQSLNMENCQSVYKVVSKLHLFSDIEEYFSVRMSDTSPGELLSKWSVDNLPIFNDFKHLESLISQRVLILEHAAKTYDIYQDEIVSLQIDYAKLGLSNNRVQMSQRLLALVKKLQSTEEVALLESEISWAKGHKEIALSLLRNIVTNDSNDVNLTATSLRQYALWMAESKRDNARDIINKYLLKSLEVVAQANHVETTLKVYHDIAKFADAEYKQVVTYMNSSVFENKVKCMENMRGTASSLRSTQNLTSHEKKALHVNERFKDLDEVEIANTRAEKESFLHLAMRYYLLSLKECDENNLSIFRVISLWVNNPSFEFEESNECTFESLLNAIPSRKFITVLPQLAPRLTSENNAFAEILRTIIKRCAMEHPHHTLPILFALKNSEKDKVITNAAASRLGSTPKSRQSLQEPRTVAAELLVNQLSSENSEMARIVTQMELICDATISLANFKPKSKESKQKIPTAEQITKLKNLDAIPIPTVTIPVNNDCKYTNFPKLNSFETYFELVGGINCPKKLSCTDSTGHKRILLIKGEDDMRQDAVMQQVFNIVNTLLEKNPVTSRNKLLIRTYKVVPMSKQSGVLEWCVGTMPIGAYLVGSSTSLGAHARYRPQDITCSAARKKLIDCHEARKSNKEKLIVFMKILRDFKPVFHYFFTEHFLDPVSWYERRLAYTKSVATSSMVGYIIGLGDRHVQNILVDKNTAEVIHIDFGIAFDQGKTLQTPETIPFRLTQDIIAGFGSSGVEGIFRGCCEKTMQLLRDNSETLLTILEVLLCDPLCNWTVTTAQQNANRDITLQGTCSSNSGLAERALLAVSSKLSGTEGGVAGGVAVPGQVSRLLTAAAAPANLCRLFPGWQPYL